ncbi:MAG: hypothetical protein ABW252_15875 [Polyangiales bacterium]
MGRREHAGAGPTFLVALCLASSACVKDAPLETLTGQNASTAETTTGPLLPLAKGNTWTYSVTKEGKTSTKVLTVEAEEEVGGEGPSSGESAFKITTTKDDKPDAVSWEALAGKRFVRYREQELSGKTGEVKGETTWDPPRLVVDATGAHAVVGASWAEAYAESVTEDDKTENSDEKDTWSVDAVDEPVTVPAGTFKALVLRRQGGSKAKTFWYVKGVGKVKEDGDELEELVAYKFADGKGSRKGDDAKGDDAKDDDAKDGDGDAKPSADDDGDAKPSADDDGDQEPSDGKPADDAPAEAETDEPSSGDGGVAAPKPEKKVEVAP